MGNKQIDGVGCSGFGCWLAVVAVNVTIGAWCTNYVLQNLFSVNIHWLLDAVIGLFLGELSIISAIVVAILKAAGVL